MSLYTTYHAECDDTDPTNRKTQDILKSIDKYLDIPTTITQAIRIGKR